MKSSLIKTVAVLALVSATIYTVVGSVSSATSTTKPTSVSVTNHTLTGNLIADLDRKDDYVANKKEVVRYNTNGREVWLNSAVTDSSAQRVVAELKALEEKSKDPIFLLLDSPGGSVYDGNLIISQIEASKAPVYAVCMRLCASMAAYIHSFGHKRLSVDRSLLMYHPASGGLRGQVPNMMSMGYSITRTINKLNANIVSRSKLTREEFEAKVAYEIWIDAEDSKEKALTDQIVALNTNPKAFDNAPGQQYEEKMKRGGVRNGTFFYLISPYDKELW